MTSESSIADVEAKLVCARNEVTRLESLLHAIRASEARNRENLTQQPQEEQVVRAHTCISESLSTSAAAHRGREHGGLGEGGGLGECVARAEVTMLSGQDPATVVGSATSYLGGPAAQDLNPGPKGKRSLKRGQGGVQVRRGQQRKGGGFAPDSYEESMWDPKVILPALGIRPIGHIRTCFPRRNGCPRQGSVVPASRATLDIVFGSNPHHSLAGLQEFSHVWLIFLFDGNGTAYTPRPNVYPPRLLGKSKGVFATRAPHRPCPIGLSLCKIEDIQGRSLSMSGVDLVDGTPILDLKPYIPCYDAPYANGQDGTQDWGAEWAASLEREGKVLRYPQWCVPSALPVLKVFFSAEAEVQFADVGTHYSLADAARQQALPRHLASWAHVREAIVQVLQADPRSVYRKESCGGEVYPFFVDELEVSVLFDDDRCEARVLSLVLVPLVLQRALPKARVSVMPQGREGHSLVSSGAEVRGEDKRGQGGGHVACGGGFDVSLDCVSLDSEGRPA